MTGTSQGLVLLARPLNHDPVDLRELQRQRLRSTIEWARKARATLQCLLAIHGARVHFRPSSSGISMVGLLPERQQRGKSGITSLARVVMEFEAMFEEHCRNVEHRRVTGEKALQSFLIAEAQTRGRHLASLNDASTATSDPVDLWFITDEISLPTARGKMVCDILALRRDGGRSTPVLIELKDERQLTRLVEQVEGYAALVDEYADLFAELFSALLGEAIRFDGPTEKWIVWPAVAASPDPRTQELLERHVRVVSYVLTESRYSFLVGPVATPLAQSSALVPLKIGSTGDPRIAVLTRIGGGEGFATYTGTFESKPAIIVDCGTMLDLLDESERCDDAVTVHVFEDDGARSRFMEQHPSWTTHAF